MKRFVRRAVAEVFCIAADLLLIWYGYRLGSSEPRHVPEGTTEDGWPG